MPGSLISANRARRLRRGMAYERSCGPTDVLLLNGRACRPVIQTSWEPASADICSPSQSEYDHGAHDIHCPTSRAPRTPTRRQSFPLRLCADLPHQLDGDHHLVWLHVGDGRDADARRLGNVDDVDADAGADLARDRRVCARNVAGDDAGDDAALPGTDAVALPPEDRDRRKAF